MQNGEHVSIYLIFIHPADQYYNDIGYAKVRVQNNTAFISNAQNNKKERKAKTHYITLHYMYKGV
jgi:hypothetical protein